MLHFENDLPARNVFFGIAVSEGAPDHEGDDRVDVELVPGPGFDDSSVAKNRDFVGNPEYLVHLVGNIDDRLPAGAKIGNLRETRSRFLCW